MRAALLILLLFLAVPAVGAEPGGNEEAKTEAAAETVPPLDEETLEILQMRELLELLELLEDVDILARMEEKE